MPMGRGAAVIRSTVIWHADGTACAHHTLASHRSEAVGLHAIARQTGVYARAELDARWTRHIAPRTEDPRAARLKDHQLVTDAVHVVVVVPAIEIAVEYELHALVSSRQCSSRQILKQLLVALVLLSIDTRPIEKMPDCLLVPVEGNRLPHVHVDCAASDHVVPARMRLKAAASTVRHLHPRVARNGLKGRGAVHPRDKGLMWGAVAEGSMQVVAAVKELISVDAIHVNEAIVD
mmetsp:Transcript_74039/g.203858  ORF Transcript_74039/g.203858 Transcript_74039/m.203858 type:complete len:234 (-) Transcript_74039:384-1085(-)